MSQIFAIDVQDRLVVGVLLKKSPKLTAVIGCGVDVRESGKALSESIDKVIEQVGFNGGECRISIGAEKFSFRNILLPFTDQKKISQVLLFELEELFSLNSDSLHVDFLVHEAGKSKSDVFTAMIDQDQFIDTLTTLKTCGFDPDICTVEGSATVAYLLKTIKGLETFLLVDVGFEQATIVLVEGGDITLIRPLSITTEKIAEVFIVQDSCSVVFPHPHAHSGIIQHFVFQIKHTLLSMQRTKLLSDDTPFFIGGPVGLQREMVESFSDISGVNVLPVNPFEMVSLKNEIENQQIFNPELMSRALALALYSDKTRQIFNFRKGNFKKKLSFKNYKKKVCLALIPLFILCLSVTGICLWEYNQLKVEQESLISQINEIFQETLPGVNRIVNPVQQVQVKIDEARNAYRIGGGGVSRNGKLMLLAEISSLVPDSLPLHIRRFIADQDNVFIKGQTKDFKIVDSVSTELKKSDYFSSVEIISANLSPKDDQVLFELKLELQ